MTFLGLALAALGAGGIKPCVAAFGGDQFKLPEQTKQVANFFSLFYFAINCGTLIGTAITPILREDVKCFEDDSCYSLAFGVPGIFMFLSVVIFLGGKFMYKMVPTVGNIVWLVTKCIGVRRIKSTIKKKLNIFNLILERYRYSMEGSEIQQKRPLAGLC